MDSLQMDISLIRDTINKISDSKMKIDSAITQINLLAGKVENYWEGSSEQYTGNLVNCANDMYVMVNDIESLIQLLNNVVYIAEHKFRSLQSDAIDLYQ